MSKPPKCDHELWEHGDHVMTIADLPAVEIEKWVIKVREDSGQRVDWHFVGGRACVRFLGDEKKVRESIQKLLPEITSRTNYYLIIEENYKGPVIPMSILKGMSDEH